MMEMKTQDTGCTYQLSETLAFLSIPSLMDLYLKGFLDTTEKGFSKNCNKQSRSERGLAVWMEENT